MTEAARRSAKEIRVMTIKAPVARRLIAEGHYSHSNVQNSQLHMGVFLDRSLLGALSFGPPLDRSKVLGLVEGTEWEQVIELNRMWLSDALPRNSESRALAVAFRLLRRHAPQIKWVLSFADGTQCGDGAIYRASGFVLTGIKTNKDLMEVPGYGRFHTMDFKLARPTRIGRELRAALNMEGAADGALLRAAGATPIVGHQFRYIRFLDPAWACRLTVPVLRFEDIPPEARMYRGTRAPIEGR